MNEELEIQPPKQDSAAERQPRSWKTKLLLGIALATILFLAWVIYLSRSLPSFAQLENITPELATKVYSADGVLIKEFYTEKRSFTALSQINPWMIQAVLATEDHRFHRHWGIAPHRLFFVIIRNIVTLSKQQGASTLTQQLARRLFLTPEKTVARKIREILTAIQIEKTYTKPEILEMYMNQMSFGHGSYGVEAASLSFFGKSNRDLNAAECALLTGMLQRPASLNPYRYPERALARRNLVLKRMLQENVITDTEYQEALKSEMVLAPRDPKSEYGIAPYFTEKIRQDLQKQYGWDLYKAGLTIYTTLDTRAQAAAERSIAKYLPELQRVVNYRMRRPQNFSKLLPPSLLKEKTLEQIMSDKAFVDSLLNVKCAVQVASVGIDPRNGHVLAMVGGRNFEESQFNRAVQARRQPGSAFKPFVFTAAVDNGYMPYYEKLNQPIVVHLFDGTRWTPRNYDESISGKTTLREALRRSLNLVTARLVQEDVPPARVVEYAHNLGISTPLEAVDAIALGPIGVYPIELISAFGVFANKGVLVLPTYILRVEDKYGNVLERSVPQSKGVLREETAYIMANMLQTAAQRGTGAISVSVYQFTRPAGGKTGTTNDFTDAWYVTFTPQFVAGTWVGLDDPALSLGESQSGTRAALPITVPFIKTAMDTLQLPVEDFERPEGVIDVEICEESKLLATEHCPSVIKDICNVEYAPDEYCTIHTSSKKGVPEPKNRTNKNRRIRY